MIPPSSLARLVLGYLEEEGLQRTAETFQEECNDAKKDPLTQYSSLKTILEEYVEIKDTASNPNNDPAKVLHSLWKKLDVIVGQLKYHTLPENKIPRVKQRTNRRINYGNLQTAKPASSHPNTSTNSNHNKNPSHNNQELVSISNRNQHVLPSVTDTDSSRVPFTTTAANVDLTLSLTSRTNPGVVVSGVSLDQQQPGNLILSCQTQSTDSSGHNVPTSQPLLGHSGNQKMPQLQNISCSTYSNNFRQDSFSSNHQVTLNTALPNSGSGSLVCTCPDNHDSQTHAATPNSDCAEIPMIEVNDDRSTSAVTSNDTVIQESGTVSGHYSMESTSNKIEILSRSPKRKGHPPKKRNFSNPSPLKQVPVVPDPSMSADNNFDLQQLLDGGNLDIDAAMPLLLDTFLSTPLLQEKLAENINKVVGSTKQDEPATEVLSESSQMPPSKVDDTASNQLDEPQVPVDDILNLMEADPAFDALFNLLSTDAVKTASPAKVSQAVPTCSYSEPVTSGSATHTACSSAEPVSTWSTTSTVHSSSFDNNISATSVVTESLLLLASSPSKCPTSLLTTSSLDNLHPISPKEVTPEFVHKQHKDGGLDSGLSGPGYVRSLHFLDQQPAAAPIGKPKKSKPARQKRNASKTTTNKTGRQRIKKLNSHNKDSQTGELLHVSSTGNIPGAVMGEPATLSTIDLSAVKRLQSFASLHSNASWDNGNGMGLKKSQSSSMVQLLQDAAIHQQVQEVLTANQKPNGASQSSSHKGLVPRSLQSLTQTNALSSRNISRQSLSPRLIAPAPSVNNQGGRTLLPRPSMQSHLYGMPLQAPSSSSSIQPVTTCPSSSPASFTSLLSSASLSPSVTVAQGMLPSLSSSSSSLASSSPFYQLLTMPSSVTSCVPPSQSSSSHLSSSSSTSYLQTPPLQSLSHVPQPSSLLTSKSSYLQPPLPQSSLSHLLQSSSSSSTASSSSYALHSSSLPPLSSSYLQPLPPPPPPSCVPQSSSPSSSSSHDSTSSMSVIQPNNFSSAQQHSYHDSSQTTYITLQSNQNTQINSQGITALVKSPSPVAMATLESQGQYTPTRLDSNEPSPTAQNAEECVSGFISGFEGGLSCGQSNNQEGSAIPMNNTLGSVSLDKDKDGPRLPKNGTNRKENEYDNERKSKNNPSGIPCEKVDKQENKRKETREVMNIGGCGAEERRHGQKRPGQDLKENKPKKSKECKKLKKSKSKSLPKDFDVDKFLSKLHYVEN